MKHGLTVEFTKRGLCIVSDEVFFVYGIGENKADALEDYKVSIVEYCAILKELSVKNVKNK